jgi:hypothetical protein
MKECDQWHPVYKTLSEWLAAEAGPNDPNIRKTTPVPRRRLLKIRIR